MYCVELVLLGLMESFIYNIKMFHKSLIVLLSDNLENSKADKNWINIRKKMAKAKQSFLSPLVYYIWFILGNKPKAE